MKRTEQEKQLIAAIKRLDKSRTCLTRARARRNVRTVLNRIEKRLLDRYPAIDLSGNTAKRRKARGCRCPICGVPMKSTSSLATHLAGHHHWMKFTGVETNITCICGKAIWSKGTDENSRKRAKHGLIYHLRKVPNLTEHFAAGALRQIGG